MALVDPYSPCPCGSLQKYKWCCQKAESAALRVERLLRSEQLDQALKAAEEGLSKEKGNYWLLSLKSYALEKKGDLTGAHAALEEVTRQKPDHEGAWAVRVSLVLRGGGVRAGVDELQLALASCGEELGPQMYAAAEMMGVSLVRGGHIFSGLAHLELAGAGEGDADELAQVTYLRVHSDPSVSPWLKERYDLLPAPESLSPERKAYYEEALREAGRGLWARASARFEMLAAEGVAGADRNLGLCRLWILDNAEGVKALRRHIAKLKNTTEAVDLELLAQIEEPADEEHQVDRVRLSWPVRDKAGLEKTLTEMVEQKKTGIAEGTDPIDPEVANSPTAEVYALLDRPIPEARPGLAARDLPRVRGRVLLTGDRVYLEAFDDAKLNDLRDDFLAIAGPSVPNAHPKLKVVERIPRHVLAMQTEWILPNDLEESEVKRIEREEQERLLGQIWPETPLPFLGGRSPRQAARAGDAEVPLRASLLQQQLLRETRGGIGGFAKLREELGVPGEPIPDPETVDVEAIHLGRLGLIPADQLDDERLEKMYVRAKAHMLMGALERVCEALIERSEKLAAKSAFERYLVYADLARCHLTRGSEERALETIARGRREEPGSHRVENAPRWDMLEIRVRARTAAPEQWVPELAATLERYRENKQASQAILSGLVDMGLVRITPHPDRPDQLLLDTRGLNLLLDRYGPRVVTSTGALGVSATKPEIWTPEKGVGGGGSGIWTPGGGAATAPPTSGEGDKPKLIIPGR